MSSVGFGDKANFSGAAASAFGAGSTAMNNSHNITFVNCNFASSFLTAGKPAAEVGGLIREVQLLDGTTHSVIDKQLVLLSNNEICTLGQMDNRWDDLATLFVERFSFVFFKALMDKNMSQPAEEYNKRLAALEETMGAMKSSVRTGVPPGVDDWCVIM